MKKFDLNIEKILDNWETYHAIREVIANALDEKLITKTGNINIFNTEYNIWRIRDYGRGLKYEHLTQNENQEKLNNPNTIGKFGIGLKDALATFERKGVEVKILSKFGDITLGKSYKHDFEDLLTLHAYIEEPSNPNFIGTEFILKNVDDIDIKKAKDLFLDFSQEYIIESTIYGHVLSKKSNIGRIYINGVKVAEEDNFLFSYNITQLNTAIKKALNRERTNVGRTAYTDRIKSILLSCKNKLVANMLVDDLRKFSYGNKHDELNWLEVQAHAVRILNEEQNTVFVTPQEIELKPNIIEELKSTGNNIVVIPKNLKEKVSGTTDNTGNPILEFDEYVSQRNENFEYRFIPNENLTEIERRILFRQNEIFQMIGGKPIEVKNVLISERMQKDTLTFAEATGLWNGTNIVIRRDQLNTMSNFAGTLLHESAHASSGSSDTNLNFEIELTKLLGILAEKALFYQEKTIN